MVYSYLTVFHFYSYAKKISFYHKMFPAKGQRVGNEILMSHSKGKCTILFINIPLLRHFTLFGQENAQNFSP